MSNWWDTAPLAQAPEQGAPAPAGQWWGSAPLAAPASPQAPPQGGGAYFEPASVTPGYVPTHLGPPPAPAARRLTPAQQEFHSAPWYRQAAQAADDVVRLAANGLTFGFADRLAAGLNNTTTEQERAQTAQARERASAAAIPAELAGGLRTGVSLANAGVTAVRPALQAMTGPVGVGLRTGAMAIDGAALGGLSAAGHGESIARGAAIGAGAGALGNALIGEPVRAVSRAAGGAVNRAPEPPTGPQLRARADAAYQAADDAGVIISSPSIHRLDASIADDLANFGFHPAMHPRVAAAVGEISSAVQSGNPITLRGLDVLRRIVGQAARSPEASERALARNIIDRIDDFIARAGPDDILAGNAQQGIPALQEARQLWSQVRRLDTVDDAVVRAERRAASTGTGGNEDNALRQNIRAILDNPNRSRGFTGDERQAMETVVRGTPEQNVMRLVGRLSPSGNGLMAALGIGAAGAGGVMGGPLGAAVATIPPAAGMLAKSLADGATRRNVDDLVRLIRAGGDRATATPAPNLLQRAAEPSRDLIARMLILGAPFGTRAVSP